MEKIILLIFVLAFDILLGLLAIYQNQVLKELKDIKQHKEKSCTTIRKHATIGQNNYNGVLNARGDKQAYEVFKNKNGLYEPVRPHQGIKIEKED